MKKSGIYLISSPSGGAYVGSSVDIERRWCRHLYELSKSVHRNPVLQRAYDKYGAALRFEIIELCDRESLLTREQTYIDLIGIENLYNLQPQAGGGSSSGRVSKPASAETREKMRLAHTGRKHSEDTKRRMSERLRGHQHSPETKRKIGATSIGRKHTAELKARNTAVQTGRAINTMPGASGYKGVSRGSSGGWRLRVLRPEGGLRNIGTFKTPDLAYAMRLVWMACEAAS